MKILVACEESQRVCKAFREKGHEAYSCDIEPCSGGHPEWHVMGDVLPLLNGHCEIETMDGKKHRIEGQWDMILAFPPCTYLTVTGNRWFSEKRYGTKAVERRKLRKDAILFFMEFTNANCEKIAVENPIGCMSTSYRKPDCIIQPWWFGEPQRKSTCLWLKGLPVLKKTNPVEPEIIKAKNGKSTDCAWHFNTINLPPKERAKTRSKTFEGIAKTMAEQWG